VPPDSHRANPSVLSVATALPPYRVGQGEMKDFARRMFSGARRDIERLLLVFDNSGVETRHFCVPLEWLDGRHSFPEKNTLYVKHALELADEAARRAMRRAGAAPEDIGAIFFFSTSGISTPSLDSKLIVSLGLSEHTRRVPIWGLGCAAGTAGLARAADHARVHPEKLVLLVGAEFSSLTGQRDDLSKSNLISSSLFGDGAAAVVLGLGGNLGTPELLGDYSTVWSGTEEVMGWELVETGLKVKLSRRVPEIVLARMRQNVEAACEANGMSLTDLRHFVLHPGGAKVLDAFEEVLELPPHGLANSRGVLRDCGNMSSVTVLFILERLLKSEEYAAGEAGILSAMGPGFSAEHVLFRF
jgi:alkylresorcinol/alkylpyrone synthase